MVCTTNTYRHTHYSGRGSCDDETMNNGRRHVSPEYPNTSKIHERIITRIPIVRESISQPVHAYVLPYLQRDEHEYVIVWLCLQRPCFRGDKPRKIVTAILEKLIDEDALRDLIGVELVLVHLGEHGDAVKHYRTSIYTSKAKLAIALLRTKLDVAKEGVIQTMVYPVFGES
ncbi:MAG: hypothetical protein MI923_26610 [Phycisphaerales bacterium]|nr:hypothetical protein [Phycisphaerales bacterium]